MSYNYNYLQTDFKDDIINEDVNSKRKYRMEQNEDGTVSFEDVTNYAQKGSFFGGNDINNSRLEINKINMELRDNIYGKYTGTIFVNGVLSGKIRYVLVTKVVRNEASGNMTDEYVSSSEIEESTQSFKIDLQPKHIYTFNLDIKSFLDKYRKTSDDKILFVDLLLNGRIFALSSQLNISALGQNGQKDGNLIDIAIYNHSDSIFKDFSFSNKFVYKAIIQTKMENLRD